MNDRERQIREEAYRIWIEKGHPDGGAEGHWYEAERRVDAASGGFEGATAPREGERVPVVAKNAGNSAVASLTRVAAKKPAAKTKAAPLKGETVDVAPAKRPGKSPPARPKG